LGSEAGRLERAGRKCSRQRGREADRRFNQSREGDQCRVQRRRAWERRLWDRRAPKFKTLRAALENVEQPLLAGIVDIELVLQGDQAIVIGAKASGRRVSFTNLAMASRAVWRSAAISFSLARSRGGRQRRRGFFGEAWRRRGEERGEKLLEAVMIAGGGELLDGGKDVGGGPGLRRAAECGQVGRRRAGSPGRRSHSGQARIKRKN